MDRLKEYYERIENSCVLLECLVKYRENIYDALNKWDKEKSELYEKHYDAVWKECRKRDLIGDDPFPDIPLDRLIDDGE